MAMVGAVFAGAFLLVSRLTSSGSPLGRLPTGVGREVALVLIVTPECGACNNPGLPSAWNTVRQRVGEQTPDSVSVRTIGIVMSGTPNAGLDFLARFGAFNEVAVGGGVRNHGALRYLFERFPGPDAFPQIVIMDRVFKQTRGDAIDLDSESVRVRVWGVDMTLRLAARLSTSAS